MSSCKPMAIGPDPVGRLTHILTDYAARHPAAPRPILVALDGRCASGKTTLAVQLQAALGCSVVTLDDFFLRPEQRTPQRLSQPGENIDHERVLSQVLLPLSRGEAAQYRPYRCASQSLGQPIRVEPTPFVLLEGSYALHPNLRPYYHLRLFLSVPPEEQMRRIVAREGQARAQVFATRWIPLEEQYIAALRPDQCCDYCFVT